MKIRKKIQTLRGGETVIVGPLQNFIEATKDAGTPHVVAATETIPSLPSTHVPASMKPP